jgi:tryptophan synthase alpha subunit
VLEAAVAEQLLVVFGIDSRRHAIKVLEVDAFAMVIGRLAPKQHSPTGHNPLMT